MKRQGKVGVIGLGNMGGGIARNFARKKFPLAVWDISERVLSPFEKMKGVGVMLPGEMARTCEVIILVVPGPKEVGDCLKGRDGILANARKGLIVYDFTSSDPAISKRYARNSAKHGVAYLDAGMSGGSTGADAGTLTLMIGGDKKAFEKTRGYLGAIAANPFHLGASGAGHTLKLIHNMVCHTIFLVTCEGGRMAERAGIRLQDMIDIFNVANARSYASEFRFPRHILSGKWDAKSRIYNLRKDLGLAVELSERLHSKAELGRVTLGFLEKAVKMGMQEMDYSLLYRDFDKIQRAGAKASVTKKKAGTGKTAVKKRNTSKKTARTRKA